MADGKSRQYLFVDGYNIIFAWDYLQKIAASSLEDARKRFLEDLSDYQGYSGLKIIVVFDGHNVANNPGSIKKYDELTVVFTKENETADQYIERCTYLISPKNKVTVATSDSLEQIITMGSGAIRISASDLRMELKMSKKEQRAKYIENRPIKRNMLMDNLDKDLREKLEKMIRQEN